jgi:dCTP deaminase
MILNDKELRARAALLFPEHSEDMDLDKQIQPASVDLRLGNTFYEYRKVLNPMVSPINPLTDDASKYMRRITLEDGQHYMLAPGRENFVLAETRELVDVPDDLVGRVDGRSSLGRLGLRIHSTAGFIDPGFRGRITLEVDAVGRFPILLTPGLRVCQISFEKMVAPAEIPYGAERGSKYLGEWARGAQPSRSYQDPEGAE